MLVRSIVAGVALGALLIAACGPAPAPAAAPAQPSQPASQAAPVAKPAASSQAPAAPATGQRRQLRVGSTNATSSYYAAVVAHAKIVNDNVPDVQLTVMETGGIVDNLNRMLKGEVEIAQGGLNAAYSAQKGIGRFEKTPIPDLRILWIYSVDAIATLVREDSGITSLQGLDGKDYSGGGTGTDTEVIMQTALEANGIKPKYYRGSLSDAQEAFKDRRIAGFSKLTGVKNPDAVIMDISTTVPIRILSWTPEMIQAMKAKYPHYRSIEIPAGVYKAAWNERPILGPANPVGWYAKANMPEDLVYKMVKAASENVESFAMTFKPAAGIDLKKMTVDFANFPLHPGAAKYYREQGLQIPAELAAPTS
jgi:TRAP transporter TAXI family solute receptor